MKASEAINRLTEYGLQNTIAVRTGVDRPTVNAIFRGKRRAGIKAAALLEHEFIKKGIPLDRWDLLYGIKIDADKPQTLAAYLRQKLTATTKGGE